MRIQGSNKKFLPNTTILSVSNPDEVIEVTLLLRESNPLPSSFNHHLSHRDYENSHGASDEDVTKVTDFATANHLKVVEVSKAKRTIHLSGKISSFTKAFSTSLYSCSAVLDSKVNPSTINYRGREGEIAIPNNLVSIVLAVLGLDNRPLAEPHFRTLDTSEPSALSNQGFTPPELSKLYNFPSDVKGKGQCAAIIELGGGHRQSDINSYFPSIGVSIPTIKSVSVDGGRNAPNGPSGADGEVCLDYDVVGGVAPESMIVIYYAPNSDRGFLDALNTAIHDTTNKPSVVSISWGSPEANWTASAMQAFNSVCQSAAALGVTVLAASGDNGSSDGINGQNADFPSSSPYVLGCGGTNLQATSSGIISETVWGSGGQGGATGGGHSKVFKTPDYQSSLSLPSRGVPDVSGVADPATGYKVLVDGQSMIIGGTSGVAPLWAGLILLLNQKLGKRLGFFQPALYKLPSGTLNDITQGSNGAYSARQGWDECTGLGSPDGNKLLSALSTSNSNPDPTPLPGPIEISGDVVITITAAKSIVITPK